MSRQLRGAALALSLVLGACQIVRPPLPTDRPIELPQEAYFKDRLDVLPIRPGQAFHDHQPLKAPVQVSEAFHAVPESGLNGPTDMYIYFIVEKDGTVKQTKTVYTTGDPRLDWNTEQLVRGWRFQPATLGGAPVAVSTGMIFRFGH